MKDTLYLILLVVFIASVIFIMSLISYNQGQMDALRGHQKYKMVVLYGNVSNSDLFKDVPECDRIDSLYYSNPCLYVPVDTIFERR